MSIKKLPFPFYQALSAAALMALIVAGQVSLENKTWITFPTHLMVFGSNYLIWAILTPVLYTLIQNYPLVRGHWSQSVVRVFGFGILIIVSQAILSNLFYYFLRSFVGKHSFVEMVMAEIPHIYIKLLFSRAIDFLVIVGVLIGITSLRAFNEQKVQLVKVKEQLAEAKLAALRMQLNPHFLFNALHTVNGFIGKDDKKARKSLILLSDLLRKTLRAENKELVSFNEEMAYINDYLGLESIRFQDRMKVNIQVPDDVGSCKIPYLLLQPIVENAIKHGISTNPDGGTIGLKATRVNNKLVIDVINSNEVPLSVNDQENHGIGLNNVSSRLKEHYDEKYSLENDFNGHECKVTIEIPYELC